MPTAQEFYAKQCRYAAYYQQVLQTADELYLQGGDNVAQGLALFDLERANVEAGQAWATAHAAEDASAAQLCCMYPGQNAPCLELRLSPRTRIQWLKPALDAAQQLKNLDWAGTHANSLSSAYRALGDMPQALIFCEQALLLTTQQPNRRLEGYVLSNWGALQRDSGDAQQGIETHKQALNIAREVGDQHLEGSVLSHLAGGYDILSQTQEAVNLFQQALQIAQVVGDPHLEGRILNNLSSAYFNIGNMTSALKLCEQALVKVREIGDLSLEANILGNFGYTYFELGDIHRAANCFEQGLVIMRRLGDRRGEGSALNNLGMVYNQYLNDTPQALELHQQALTIAREIRSRQLEAIVLMSLSEDYLKLAAPQQAEQYIQQALKILLEIGDRYLEGNALLQLALTQDQLGERQQALTTAEKSLALCEAIQSPTAAAVRQQLAIWQGQTA